MFLLILTLYAAAVSCKMSCIGEDGNPVDMFVIYKLPRITWYDVPPLVKYGHGYAYLDSTNIYFKLSKISVASNDSSIGRTLDQVYNRYTVGKDYQKSNSRYLDGPTDQAHVFYNDATPEGKEYFDNGHTKGVIAFNADSGFWVITSVPKYPPHASDGYNYPHSGFMYGQMFMCVSFNSTTFNDIGLQLRFNNPHVHDSNLPTDWEETYPNIHKILNGDIIKESPFSNHVSLTSLAGIKYEHFAKAGGFNRDLYHDFVAPSLESNLLTETWQHGETIGPSCDGEYTVLDIIKLNVKLPIQDFPFINYDDHSKFVVANKSSARYVCVGDINREPSQFTRGGGTMCLRDENLWNKFFGVIVETTQCP